MILDTEIMVILDLINSNTKFRKNENYSDIIVQNMIDFCQKYDMTKYYKNINLIKLILCFTNLYVKEIYYDISLKNIYIFLEFCKTCNDRFLVILYYSYLYNLYKLTTSDKEVQEKIKNEYNQLSIDQYAELTSKKQYICGV